MNNLVVVVSALAFFLGVAWRSAADVSLAFPVWFLFLSFVVGLVWRRKSFAFSAPFLLLTSLTLLFVSLGVVRSEVYSWQFNVSPLENNLSQTVDLTGVITSEPDYRETSVHLYVQVDNDLVLVTTDRLGDFKYGDEVTVNGKLEKPESFTTDLGRTFNYPGYLLAKGVEYKISFAQVKATGINDGNLFLASLLKAKQVFVHSFESVIPSPQSALGGGLLLGIKSALGIEVEENFRRTGIIHIVVLSGYNVMLVVAFIMFVFSWFLPLRFRIGAGIVAIISFALIVGLSATVVRASIMATLVLMAQVFGRRYDVLRALILAGWLMIILNPYLLVYDVGFQLSFMATLGLILIVPQLEASVINNFKGVGFKQFFLATVATQIAVLPILMFHIGEVSLISVLVNMLVLPVVPAAMLLTFVTGLVGLFSTTLASLVGWLASLSLDYILAVANIFGSLTYASIPVPEFSIVGVILMYLVMGSILFYGYQSKKGTQLETVLTDWTIEEEFDEDNNKKADTTIVTASEDKLPIFFR